MFKYTNTKTKNIHRIARQRGSALIFALVFLLLMTLIGTTAMQGTGQQEKMAGNMRDRNLAFQAAEAALRAGERLLESPAVPPTNFGAATGLLLAQADTFWMTYDWNNQSLTPPMASALAGLSQQPRYVIEDRTLSNPPNAGDPECATPSLRCYRITARGVGGTADAVVILQSTFYRL